MYDFRGISPKWVLTPLKKTTHHIFKVDVFSKILWWFHEPYHQVKCRWRNKIFSELYTIKNFEFRVVTFILNQTIDLIGLRDILQHRSGWESEEAIMYWWWIDTHELFEINAQKQKNLRLHSEGKRIVTLMKLQQSYACFWQTHNSNWLCFSN